MQFFCRMSYGWHNTPHICQNLRIHSTKSKLWIGGDKCCVIVASQSIKMNHFGGRMMGAEVVPKVGLGVHRDSLCLPFSFTVTFKLLWKVTCILKSETNPWIYFRHVCAYNIFLCSMALNEIKFHSWFSAYSTILSQVDHTSQPFGYVHRMIILIHQWRLSYQINNQTFWLPEITTHCHHFPIKETSSKA